MSARTPESLGSPGLPAGLTEATLEPRTLVIDLASPADEPEDTRPARAETVAANLLSTLRTRLPQGWSPRVSYSVTTDDDALLLKQFGHTRVEYVVGATRMSDRYFTCKSAVCGSSPWDALERLVKRCVQIDNRA